jgi:competence protein ComEC
MKTPIIINIFLFFIIGVFICDIFRNEKGLLIIPFIIILLLILRFSFLKIILFIFSFLIGYIYIFYSIKDINNLILPNYASIEKNIEIKGFIKTYPKQKNNKIEFILDAKQLKQEEKWVNINEEILVKKYGIHDFSYGDSLLINGEIILPKNFNQFNYKRFLEKDNIFTIINNPKISKINNKNNDFWKNIFKLREFFENKIRENIPFPESEYALGIVLGAEYGIPENIINNFNITGLRHLLALSGFNITILIIFIMGIFFFLPIWIRVVISSIIIFLFVILTGMSSSVIRAAIMGVLGMMALYSGRNMSIMNLLIFTLFIISLFNPFLLLSDPSLQLSVLALIGIFYIPPILEKYLKLYNFLPEGIVKILHASVSAQIAVLPLMIVFFNQISIISPIANIIVIPFTTISMISTFLSSLPYIELIFSPITYIILHFIFIVTETLSSIPYASINTPKFPNWTILLFYGVILFIIIYKIYFKNKEDNN